jgi:hypothetical protein
MHQLQRWLCVPSRIDVGVACGRDMCSGQVQCGRRDGMHQLQRRLCVPCGLELVFASCSDMRCGYIQRVWRHVVQHLRRRQVQLCWGRGLYILQRRLRVPCGLELVDTAGCDMSCWYVQCRWCDGMQQLQRWHVQRVWRGGLHQL